MGVGYDGVDVAAAKARGVVVTHTPDVLNDEVADTAIGLMLCAARQLPRPTASCAPANGPRGRCRCSAR
jgi:lactate dehydrogenase-like 2-hydroxyacid dehydrogenase